MEENFERAAAIAVFHGHVRRAVSSLRDGAVATSQCGNEARSESNNNYSNFSNPLHLRPYAEHDITWSGWVFS